MTLTSNISNLSLTKQPLIQEATLNTILKNNKIKPLKGTGRVGETNKTEANGGSSSR